METLGASILQRTFSEMLVSTISYLCHLRKHMSRETNIFVRALILSGLRLEPRVTDGLSSGLSSMFSESHLFVKKM